MLGAFMRSGGLKRNGRLDGRHTGHTVCRKLKNMQAGPESINSQGDGILRSAGGDRGFPEVWMSLQRSDGSRYAFLLDASRQARSSTSYGSFQIERLRRRVLSGTFGLKIPIRLQWSDVSAPCSRIQCRLMAVGHGVRLVVYSKYL